MNNEYWGDKLMARIAVAIWFGGCALYFLHSCNECDGVLVKRADFGYICVKK